MIGTKAPRRLCHQARGMANLMGQVDMDEFTGYVYALLDPRTKIPRYVGLTRQNPRRRLRQHVTAGRTMAHYPVARWVGSLLEVNLEPEMVIIGQYTSAEIMFAAEVAAIATYRARGYPLLNLSPGGESGGTAAPRPPEWGAKISARLKGRPKPPRTPEWRASHSAKMTGRVMPAEVRQKISAARLRNRTLITKVCACGTTFMVIPSRAERINWCGPTCPARPDGTTCVHGHEWTPENTRIYDGVKYCIACERARGRRRRRNRAVSR